MKNSNFLVPDSFPDRNICVLGLGFVGVTLSTCLANLGFSVEGVEIRKEVIDELESGRAHFFEPGLSDLVNKAIKQRKLTVFNSIPSNSKSTVFIITAGTPLDDSGKVNLNSIKKISRDISAKLKDGDLVILRSTVKLGTTNDIVKPILEESGKQFDLAFCPERTIEGQAMNELRHLPQIIGADSFQTAVRVSQIFQFMTPTVVKVSDCKTAEMIKLVDNTKRDVMFGYANEIAKVCNTIGLNAEEVITSGRFGYSRTNLPMPGPVGGPCLSKDPYILEQSLLEYGVVPEITMAARKINEGQMAEVTSFLFEEVSKLDHIPNNFKIAMLGIAFKGQPETDDVRGSTAKLALNELKQKFPLANIVAFDPVVSVNSIEDFGVKACTSIEDALDGASLVLILNNHKFFSKLKLENIALLLNEPAIIYDFWNTYSKDSILPKGVSYISLGSHKKPLIGVGVIPELHFL